MSLLLIEMRRALTRRVVRVLILIALLLCALAGIIAFAASSGKTIAELHNQYGDPSPAILTDWWVAANSDGAVLIAAFFLLIGGLFGGAAVAGAEWRAGTITTVLTWEPRRVRLHLCRTAACAILAFVIALVLQMIFLASFLPAVLVNGTTAGADLDFWISLGLVIVRVASITSIAAVFSVALATIGRNTAFALAVVFAWFAVIESMIRSLRPGWAQYLWGEQIATVVPWDQIEGEGFSRGPLLALFTIIAYTAVLVIAATLDFRRRDIAGIS